MEPPPDGFATDPDGLLPPMLLGPLEALAERLAASLTRTVEEGRRYAAGMDHLAGFVTANRCGGGADGLSFSSFLTASARLHQPNALIDQRNQPMQGHVKRGAGRRSPGGAGRTGGPPEPFFDVCGTAAGDASAAARDVRALAGRLWG
jgi:hypothetical protein